MYWSTASLLRLASPLLALIAVAGYLVGHQHTSTASAGAPGNTTRIAYSANVLLEYPAGWQTGDADSAPTIPGLSILHATLLAPAGDGAHSGLLSGQMSGEGPLPAELLSKLHGTPHTEVVELLNAQAYRYSRLSPRGYDRTLDIYVIPALSGSKTVLACYAEQALAASMRQCRAIVAGLTLAGSSPADLTPDAGYAAHLGRLVGRLDAQRLGLRLNMRGRSTASAVARFAATLAEDLGDAANSLAALQALQTAGPTQMALTRSILGAQRAYDALAAAALAREPAAYATARTRVGNAEASIDAALQAFTLLGYSRPR